MEKNKKTVKNQNYINQAKDKFGTEIGEDSTKYGEFVCSYFAWIPPEEQKDKAQRLQNITKK